MASFLILSYLQTCEAEHRLCSLTRRQLRACCGTPQTAKPDGKTTWAADTAAAAAAATVQWPCSVFFNERRRWQRRRTHAGGTNLIRAVRSDRHNIYGIMFHHWHGRNSLERFIIYGLRIVICGSRINLAMEAKFLRDLGSMVPHKNEYCVHCCVMVKLWLIRFFVREERSNNKSIEIVKMRTTSKTHRPTILPKSKRSLISLAKGLYTYDVNKSFRFVFTQPLVRSSAFWGPPPPNHCGRHTCVMFPNVFFLVIGLNT